MYQRTVEIQQRRWFKGDRHLPKAIGRNPKRTESGNEAIQDAEIRDTPTRSIENQ
jgi:hypothetical protein